MNAWDIYTYDFPEAGPHPAVIISSPERAERKPFVSVLLGSSQRAGRPANAAEVLLNGADGLDWETLVKCDLIHAVSKSELRDKRGNRQSATTPSDCAAHDRVQRLESIVRLVARPVEHPQTSTFASAPAFRFLGFSDKRGEASALARLS